MFGKKSTEKSEKTVFLYSNKYRYQKMGGENARNNFSRNTLIARAKNVGKKIVGKSAKNVYFIFTQISLQNMGGENTRNNFSETQE